MRSQSPRTEDAQWRKAIYAILIFMAAGQWIGKILAVNSVDRIEKNKFMLDEKGTVYQARMESLKKIWADPNFKNPPKTPEEEKARYAFLNNLERPFLSANDRSRWLTVRSLVEYGTYEVDKIVNEEPLWDCIDLVKHKNSQGEPHLYSSKPPLMATMIAGQYWVLHKLTGWKLGGADASISRPYELGRIMLIINNVIPMVVAWWLLAMMIEEWGTTNFGRIVTAAALCFATMLVPYAFSLTNHLWGACAAVVAVWHATRIWQGDLRPHHFFATGLWAMFTVTCELPAAIFFATIAGLLLLKHTRKTMIWFAPSSGIVLAAFLGTNYLAHDTIRPAYSYGGGDAEAKLDGENWYDYTHAKTYEGAGGEKPSYWTAPNNPVDRGEANLAWYSFNTLIGHHGFFSLTPILLLSIPGFYLCMKETSADKRWTAIVVIVASVVCICFYLFMINVRQRNYGGHTNAFRQLLWLHPLWLLFAVPMLDRLASKSYGRWIAGILLMISMISASYPTWTPWTPSWIWRGMESSGIQPIQEPGP
jgi:hypothetical protein